MTETANLSLPLIQPAQAQKHVTVNEAIARLDGVTQLCLQSVSESVPPASVAEGAAFGVPPGAGEAWAGRAGQVAVRLSGGWIFVAARRGWRAMVLDAGQTAIFDGVDWRLGALSLSPGGGALAMRALEVEVSLGSGGIVGAPLAFPARAIAFGVTGRVTEAITGTATAWSLGVEGEAARYGSGLGLGLNSWVNGPSAPQVTWSETPLVLTAEGGVFAGGTVRLVAHFAELSLPDVV